jgi:exonuclease III
LERTPLEYYNLGAKFCRSNLKNGGACIFVHESLNFSNINLQELCIEQDIEICAIKIHLHITTICIISIYRSPNGNFLHFIRILEVITNKIYNSSLHFIICGDFNINYLNNSCKKKQQLDTLLATFNLTSTVFFPTTVQNGVATAINNIFTDVSKNETYTIYSHINGLLDHDAQIINLNNFYKQEYYSENKSLEILIITP